VTFIPGTRIVAFVMAGRSPGDDGDAIHKVYPKRPPTGRGGARAMVEPGDRARV
jgi:hypothetical protein